MEPKTVSLSGELHMLMRAVDGARDIAERLNESRFHDGNLPLSLAASLALVRERLRLLDRAVRGSVDPRLLWCPENDAVPLLSDGTDDGNDVRLNTWSDDDVVRRRRREWKAALRQRRRNEGEH
jgi:hypothetical protein